ncbi:hypothetical protein LTR37_002745 [Vermiconidia calcicola]|uniref:Uncharacterized protein n=1 Tax=Vermiconidia calcicola TaxID=1690605 RepID=A0ACC3NS08_9PEZI|nr:hypothetical protein LTR37_002745 [Vermiconidia calcicola]
MSHFRNGPVAPGIAFITGGARGLGNAIAVAFAKEGSKGVALMDIQKEETFNEGKAAVEKYGAKVLKETELGARNRSANESKCITIHADVTKEEDVERAVQETVETFGRIDYAANFAGIVGPLDMTWDMDIAQWRKVIEVNTIGLYICNKHELKQMLKQESIEVEQGRPPQQGSIAALEARSHNIRVNAVSPGFLPTKIGESVTTKDHSGMLETKAWSEYEARQGRKAHPDEIGDVVVLLSTPRMSLVNGHNLVIECV